MLDRHRAGKLFQPPVPHQDAIGLVMDHEAVGERIDRLAQEIRGTVAFGLHRVAAGNFDARAGRFRHLAPSPRRRT
jgi:hypothetical protein